VFNEIEAFGIRNFICNDQLEIIIQEIIFYFQTIFSLFNHFWWR